MLAQLGIESRFVRGMRVTDRPTMDVVEMVLVGKINKEIVSLVNRHGGRAVGLSGKDGDLIRARKIRMSDPAAARTATSTSAWSARWPASIRPSSSRSTAATSSPSSPRWAPASSGETYNINADLVAAKVAEALRAEKLILLTDVEGIRGADGEVVPTLDAETARAADRRAASSARA